MGECELSPGDSWDAVSLKRMAWAHSRESWQAPDSDEQSPDGALTDSKPSPTSETGAIPSKIASWLRDCRTPLGASLDEQSNSPVKGPLRNGCSFEDDLSLGAEANHLQNSSTKPEDPVFSMPAKEKRSQFKQKGRSMNSTGSGKSSGTVSSVSELLDLYEEDPEEILYNLGFGREEPDIASKIPSRFFNSASGAKGIDIKVYLGAQMQRMELENPNYALTSRFRQTEVLATVANVFSEIYSQVSGRPIQKIATRDGEPKDPAPLKRNNSALNVAKILKRNITKPNLLQTVEGATSTASGAPSPNPNAVADGDTAQPDPESKSQPKAGRKKDSLALETVTEETAADARNAALPGETSPLDPVGETQPVVPGVPDVSVSEAAEQTDGETELMEECKKGMSSSTPERETPSLLPIPHMAHLHSQPRDSFEMEELPPNEDEAVFGGLSISRAGSERFLRTASQQSDSSGFAEEPSTDISANYLKVQESSDSCDSENTVTSHAGGVSTPVALDHPAFERLQGDEDPLSPSSRGRFGLPEVQEEVHDCVDQPLKRHQTAEEMETQALPDELTDTTTDIHSSTESGSTLESTDTTSPEEVHKTLAGEQGSAEGHGPENPSSSSSALLDLAAESDQTQGNEKIAPEKSSGSISVLGDEPVMSASEKVRHALLRAQQRSSSCEERMGRVWVRGKDLLPKEDRPRNPMRRSSSLPTSFISPTRVVSSLRIQLGHGSVRHCTPPMYSYRYEEEREEADSIAEEMEGEDNTEPRCTSTLLVNPARTEAESFGSPQETETDRGAEASYPPPLNTAQHRTRSASSLYSIPADWPLRRLAEGPVWSSNSVPDLTMNAPVPHPSLPSHLQHHLPPYRGATSSPYPRVFHSPVPCQSPVPAHNATYPQPHNMSCSHAAPTPPPPPLGFVYSQPNLPYPHPHGSPYDPSAPYHSPYNPVQSAPYNNLQGGTYTPHVPLAHLHSAPYGQQYNNNMPYYQNASYSPHYSAPFTPPGAPCPCATSTPPPAMGSTEMQLRRVLHDIRGAVQSLGQGAPGQRADTPTGTHSPHQAAQPLYQELQMRRRSLNTFRAQMSELEMALMRQQSVVYQHLSSEQRHEAEQLQRLRLAVRQELQELELQLEDRLLTISDHLCRHPLGMSRGHSMDSLSSSSALRAMEPVSDLLREQEYLQSELSYDGLSGATPCSSGRSSRAPSPSAPPSTTAAAAGPSHRSSPSPQCSGVYRSSVCLTPAVPPRPGAQSAVLQEDRSGQSGDEPGVPKVGDGTGNVQLQQLIHEIRQSLAQEIRQEIVSELLAAVSPRRSPVAPRESPA